MFVRPAGPARGLSINQWHYAGKELFQVYATWQAVIVAWFTPGTLAGVIADERAGKTMSSRLVSWCSSGKIVLGVLGARSPHPVFFVGLGSPILVLVDHFAGVSLAGALVYIAATATTAFFLGADSILLSTQARRAPDAVVCVYLLDEVWHTGPLIAPGEAFGALPVSDGSSVGRLGLPFIRDARRRPGRAFLRIPNVDNSVWMMLLQLGLGALMTTAAVLRLRPAFRNDESKPRDSGAGARRCDDQERGFAVDDRSSGSAAGPVLAPCDL
jgi:hypothetical protein